MVKLPLLPGRPGCHVGAQGALPDAMGWLLDHASASGPWGEATEQSWDVRSSWEARPPV